MKHPRRTLSLLFLSVLLLAFMASCSNKGVHMPKHRKRRHCDCPTFAQMVTPTTLSTDGLRYY
ncbi:MAG: hypothetical protein II633_05010 [Bacteroidales bacterium]|nr:hypothetical protein [Bacteroidales bacterium]